MRRPLALALATLACTAPPAGAAPRPLARADHDAAVALAGDQALVTQVRGRVLSVYSVPVTGGTPARVFAYTVPPGTTPDPVLAASAQRVAIAITMVRRQQTYASQAFTGTLGGPWTALGPRTRPVREQPNVFSVQVDGDRLFAAEFRGSFANVGVTAYAPTAFDVPFYSPVDAFEAVFAGDLVTYSTAVPGGVDEEFYVTGGRHVVVRDWRAGVNRWSFDFPERVTPVALKPDGTVLVVGENRVWAWAPGSPPRTVGSHRSGTARFAGDRIVVSDQRGPRLGSRRIGTPTESAGAIAADTRHLLWIANGCLLAAGITDTASGPLGPGPCPRSEIADANPPYQARPLARTVNVRLRCVSSPSSCRGTVRLGRWSRPSRFTIPAGRTGAIRVQLTSAGYRRARKGAQGAQYPLPLTARTDDGADLPQPEGGARFWVSPSHF